MAIKTALNHINLSDISEAWPTLRRFDGLKLDGYAHRGNIQARADKERGFVIDIPTPKSVGGQLAAIWAGDPTLLLQADAGEDVQDNVNRLLKEEFSNLPVLARPSSLVVPATIGLDLTLHAAKQFSSACGFKSTEDFLRDVEKAPDIAAQRFNRWFHDSESYNADRSRKADANNVTQFLRSYVSDPKLLQETKSPWIVRALLSSAYKCIDTTDILTVLFGLLEQNKEKYPEGKVSIEASFDDAQCWFTVTNKALSGATKRGDVVYASMRGGTSDVGTRSATVQARMVIRSCSNGATLGREISMRHLGRRNDNIPEDFFSEQTQRAQQATLLLELRDAMNVAFDEIKFQEQINYLDSNQALPVTPAEVKPIFEAVQSKLGISDETKDALFAKFCTGHHEDGSPNNSKDGVIQAITAVGTTLAKKDYNAATVYEDLGGRLHELKLEAWKKFVKAAADDPKKSAKLI
jgi:hypothetical protein